MKNRYAFTLLELVFVIAIISLLLTIILPMLSMSKDKARKTKCVVNLNQLGTVTKLYADEQAYYPDGYRETPEGIFYWFGFIDTAKSVQFDKGPMHDYIKNPGILLCPAFTEKYKSISSSESTCSYGINMEYVGGNPEPYVAPTEIEILNGTAASSKFIKQADKTLMYMDTAFVDSGELSESPYFWAKDFYAATAVEHEARSHFRHRKVAVGVFCDGHTEDNILPDAINDKNFKVGWPTLNICERY